MADKFCEICGAPVRRQSTTLRCRSCAASQPPYCPTREQMDEAGAEIRREWPDKLARDSDVANTHRKQFVPRVYHLDRSLG